MKSKNNYIQVSEEDYELVQPFYEEILKWIQTQ